MPKKLYIYPTSRRVLDVLEVSKTNIHININDFFSKVAFVKDKAQIDTQSRLFFLNEAIKNIKNINSLFGEDFSSNFIFFVKNSQFVFKFFDEIVAEKQSLKEIETKDLNGEFEEHIEILQALHTEYSRLLDKNNLYDKSTIKQYDINENFLKEYDEIEFILEGYLSKKEYALLEQCTKHTIVLVKLYATAFNKKMIENFEHYEIEQNYTYKINLNTKKCKRLEKLEKTKNIQLYATENRISQCSLIAKIINDFVQSSLSADKIAIIVPDEDFSSTLFDMDMKKNLNFAMGIAFSQSKTYNKLNTIYSYLNDSEDVQLQESMKFLQLEDILKNALQNEDKIESLLFIIDEITQENKEREILINKISFLEHIKTKINNMSFKEVLYYFLHLLKNETISHKDGGKVTVLGVLESRNMQFDGVIIIDFNNGFVPKINQKDIFLNSQIKKQSKIPTKQDRENLQLYYYLRLLQNSKNVAISYSKGQNQEKSKFLLRLLPHSIKSINVNYDYLLFNTPSKTTKKQNEIKVFKNEDNQLSYSKLKTFIQCKQKFYNKYILKLNISNNITNGVENWEAGDIVHKILKNATTKQKAKDIVKDIKDTAIKLKNTNKNELFISLNYIANNIDEFQEDMIKEDKENIQTEEKFKIQIDDISIIGSIDKINIIGNIATITDYKVKAQNKQPKTIDKLQLYIYYLAQKEKFQNIELVLHYLLDNKKIPVIIDEELKEEFETSLKEYKEEFEITKCDDKNICKYCDYKIMCGRN